MCLYINIQNQPRSFYICLRLASHECCNAIHGFQTGFSHAITSLHRSSKQTIPCPASAINYKNRCCIYLPSLWRKPYHPWYEYQNHVSMLLHKIMLVCGETLNARNFWRLHYAVKPILDSTDARVMHESLMH